MESKDKTGKPGEEADIGTGKPGLLSSDFFRKEYEMNFLLGNSVVPQITIWDGIVMGGGVGVSVFGEFRIATEKCLFAMPETGIGLFPDVGSSAWIPHLNIDSDDDHGVGLYIALTGCRLNVKDLHYAGIATHAINSTDLPEIEKKIQSLEMSINNPTGNNYLFMFLNLDIKLLIII